MWEVMFWPLMACLLFPGLLVYLGLHVLKREIIFVDIAMAQMASLGACVAVLFHHDLRSPAAFMISMGFTLLGGAIFSAARKRRSEVPLEAIIGIVYVMAAAMAVLLLSRAAEGDAQIKNMLVGNILLVTAADVWKTVGLLSAIALFHWILRKPFLTISFEPEKAWQSGMRVRWWDFLFYASLGLVATILVRVAGVLLVFTYLIVPAACSMQLAKSFGIRLLVGWGITMAGGVAGLFLSFWLDLPSGAAIVCTFGVLMILASFIGLLQRRLLKKT